MDAASPPVNDTYGMPERRRESSIPFDLLLAATGTGALGALAGLGQDAADAPGFLPAISAMAGLCGLAAGLAARAVAGRSGGRVGVSVLFSTMAVAGVALTWAGAGVGRSLGTGCLLIAALALVAFFSVRMAVAAAVVSSGVIGWAFSARQGGDAFLPMTNGLLLAMAAFVLVVISARGETPHRSRLRSGVDTLASAASVASEDELRSLIDSARVPMWLARPDGARTYLSRGWLEFTGRAMSQELGNGWTIGVHPDDRRLADGVEPRTGSGREREYRLKRFDGEYRWMRERGQTRLGPRGAVIGLIGSCVDITERKLRETALQDERAQLALKVEQRTAELAQANAELAKAARLKDSFLANVSHELRTPLTAILGLSETLLTGSQGPLIGKQRRSIQTIEEGGQHLLSLINEILDLAKIDAGEMTLEPKDSVSIEAVCQGSLRFVREMAQKKGVVLSSTTDGAIGTFRSDERRVKQVLVNLLGNAVKFTPPGGSVGLEVVGDRSESVVRLTVWDTGIGIPKADMERLYQPFVQLDDGRDRQHGGTGLGLALSRRMVELLGGRIFCGSEEGKGSRFTVVLPAGPPDPEAAASAPMVPTEAPAGSPAPVMAPRRVLLVEDSPELRTMLADYLEGQRHHVVVAASGAEAIAVATRERPDVILMDIEMSGVDGLEAITRIRTVPGLETIPIMALTARAMRGDRERCLAAGATEYLSKPVNLSRLGAWIVALPKEER